MTIKRRLHITNVLVLVIPVVIALLMNVIVLFIYWHVLGIGPAEEIYDYDYESLGTDAILLGLLSPLVVLIAIPLTNVLLTRFVLKKITDPIDMLVYGVHQIRDGNLSYRIDYAGNDEFTSICADFNEMARRLQEMVAEQQRNETERKELIAGISHDLRTPLTSIKAYVEGLEKGIATTPESQRKYLATIGNKAADMEQIINQLFSFSKLDIEGFPLALETEDIVAVLADLTDDLSEEYEEKGLHITLAAPPTPLYARIDQRQLRIALLNIFENSVKYKMKDVGTLAITCSEVDGIVAIELSDDGMGVPAQTLDKLFTVFYRVDASRSATEGSGLGLAITAKTIERMGGRIVARNVAEGGLSLLITLPCVRGAVT